MLYTGVDIVEIERIRLISKRYGERFLNRIYTLDEQGYCRGRPEQLATRFAAKEAVMKALGTGTRGVGWTDIEVVRQPGQPPEITLHSRARTRACCLGIIRLAVSLSHSNDFAIASVVGEAP